MRTLLIGLLLFGCVTEKEQPAGTGTMYGQATNIDVTPYIYLDTNHYRVSHDYVDELFKAKSEMIIWGAYLNRNYNMDDKIESILWRRPIGTYDWKFVKTWKQYYQSEPEKCDLSRFDYLWAFYKQNL